MTTVPPKARVRSYPVVEKNKWVFIWMGDTERADEALLPDNFSCDHPEWQYKPGYLHYPTPYLLICDNLLDFSHLSYVHAGTLGGSTRIAEVAPTVKPLAQWGERFAAHRATCHRQPTTTSAASIPLWTAGLTTTSYCLARY
jgi:phenylpropionate dioxygenase-like ring-hydroxylating dioxygenase large terminal subunit